MSIDVNAAEFNLNSYTSATKTGTKNRYRATEIYNTGMSNTYTFGTQYSGQISDIETYFSYPFSANMTYRLTYNMNTDDFRNNFGTSYWWYCDQDMTNTNAHVQSVNYVSYKKVTFTFTPTEATTCIRVWLRSKNTSSTAITGVSNWRLNNITIYDPEWQNGTSSSAGSQGTSPGSSGTSSTNNNDEIINNATENTHTIVDNQNSNTQDIINNNNQNTQAIIDSNKTCKHIDKKNVSDNGKTLNSQGVLVYSDSDGVTDYMKILNGSIKVLTTQSNRSKYSCFYNVNKVLISCINTQNYTAGSSVTIPDNAYYFRASIHKGDNKPQFEICLNSGDALNESLTDSNVNDANSDASDFFGSFQTDTYGLSSIITAPLNLIESLTSTTCQDLVLPLPFVNQNLTLPCMTTIYQQNFGTFFTIYQTITFGIVSYWVIVRIFNLIKDFKNPDHDEIEVMDL